MSASDLTTELLKQIRDGVYQTNIRLDQTRTDLAGRIDQTNARLDQTNEHIDRTRIELLGRIDETNSRLDTTNARLDTTNVRLGRLEGQVSEMVGHMGTLVERGDGLASDVADLRRRVEALESRP